MATHPDLTDPYDDDDSHFSEPPSQAPVDLDLKVQCLQAEVEILQQSLYASLNIQKDILRSWPHQNKPDVAVPCDQAGHPFPAASSTPFTPDHYKKKTKCTVPQTPRHALSSAADPHSQSDSLELINTTKVLAAALHQAKLEPPTFANDGAVLPEEWLQSVNTYRSSLGLTDSQTLDELPRFLSREPKKWFSVLNTHITTWAQFCELFRTVFLPADNQERIWRGILDRTQHSEEPLPTFVAHMLSEFKRLRNPPTEQEQVELICKHTQEKYRVALYGAHINSAIELLMHAHDLHSVLGPNTTQRPNTLMKNRPDRETYCYKCSTPGFTVRTCPKCSTRPTNSQLAVDVNELPHDQDSSTNFQRTEFDRTINETQPARRKQGNFYGGRTFYRGHPPPRQ